MLARKILITVLAWCVPLALLLLAAQAGAESIPAWIVGGYDGDTYTSRGFFGQERRLRLACADAPEIRGKQPGALEARDFALHLIRDRWVATVKVGESHGREVVHIILGDGVDLATALVGNGWARAATNYPYCRAKARELREREAFARWARLGIWGHADPRARIMPRDWRGGKREAK